MRFKEVLLPFQVFSLKWQIWFFKTNEVFAYTNNLYNLSVKKEKEKEIRV